MFSSVYSLALAKAFLVAKLNVPVNMPSKVLASSVGLNLSRQLDQSEHRSGFPTHYRLNTDCLVGLVRVVLLNVKNSVWRLSLGQPRLTNGRGSQHD